MSMEGWVWWESGKKAVTAGWWWSTASVYKKRRPRGRRKGCGYHGGCVDVLRKAVIVPGAALRICRLG